MLIQLIRIFLDTPLHFASSAGKYEIIQYLIIKNANVNLLNNQGFSPLVLAVKGRYSDCVKILLDNSADIKLKYGEKNLLEIAFDTYKNSIETQTGFDVRYVRYLADKNKSLNNALKIGDSYKNIESYILMGDLDEVKNMIKKGQSINNSKINLSILSICDLNLIDYLFNVEILNKDILNTYWWYLIDKKQINFIDNLISKNYLDKNNNFYFESFANKKLSPLSYSIINKNIDMVKYLINKKVNFDIDFLYYSLHYSPISFYILREPDLEIEKMLFDNGGVIDNNTINSLISFNKIDYLKFLC